MYSCVRLAQRGIPLDGFGHVSSQERVGGRILSSLKSVWMERSAARWSGIRDAGMGGLVQPALARTDRYLPPVEAAYYQQTAAVAVR
jgi:hypothetical protein